ncbi:TPA: integrase family protein [Stenotrophomonas maltophilia]|nr:integrase family protein [Stenotrophomonas maltophilia]HDS1011326.1 integrase family protein [Stenotrophomonas maltophilia]HDS1020278.1 integrase family protein [Stenotrophomonas maltophilia]
MLQARKLASGAISFYYRYTGPNRRQDRLSLGSTMSLAEARAEAAILARRYQAGERDLRGALLADEAAAADEAARAKAAATARSAATLGALMNAYVSSLKEAGKVSAGSVEKAVKLHIEKAWPALWERPAAELELDDLLPILSRMVREKKLREGGKIRSYLRAAYAAAIAAKQDAAAPDALRLLNVSRNPARDLATLDSGQPRDRVLSVAELRAYWRRIEAMPGKEGALVRFHLLTGGQRIAQLMRLKWSDHDHDTDTGTGSVRLLDIKGRRRVPRVHLVPLLPLMAADLAVLRGDDRSEGGGDGARPHLFSLTGGKAPATYDEFRGIMDPVVASMVAAGELTSPFTPGDLRRTVETRLAALGLSEEVRGHLQSHGLSGVQKRHYNFFEYDAEKRAAVEALYELLTGAGATVVPMRKGLSR